MGLDWEKKITKEDLILNRTCLISLFKEEIETMTVLKHIWKAEKGSMVL